MRLTLISLLMISMAAGCGSKDKTATSDDAASIAEEDCAVCEQCDPEGDGSDCGGDGYVCFSSEGFEELLEPFDQSFGAVCTMPCETDSDCPFNSSCWDIGSTYGAAADPPVEGSYCFEGTDQEHFPCLAEEYDVDWSCE